MNINTRNLMPEKNWLIRLISLSLLIISTTVLAAPAVPTLNSPSNGATNVAQANVKFTWSASSGTSVKYRFLISQNSSFSGFNSSTLTCDNTCYTAKDLSTTSHTINLSSAGKTYYWKVRAYNSTGTSSWSTSRSFTTASVIPKTTPLASSYMSSIGQGFGVWNSAQGGYHTGYDIGAANGNPSIYAVDNGTVVWNSTASTKYTTPYTKYYNAFVIIKHDSGFYAYYGHLNSSLSVNSRVTRGASIGTIRDSYKCTSGSYTTCSTYSSYSTINRQNNHLHISISKGSNWITSGWGYQTTSSGLAQFVNPASYIGL